MEREGLSQQDLAERLFVTKGNISGLIDRLVSSGLVERRKLKGDRRTHAIYMTPQGRKVGLQGIALQREFVMDTLGKLSPVELAQMDALFARTSDILGQNQGGSSESQPE